MLSHKIPAPSELTPEHLREIAVSFQKSRIFLTAYELDIFTALGDAKRTAGEVAAAIGCDERATDRLMNALCALGILHKTKEYFSNSALTARYLVKGKPDYLAGLMHTVNLWDNWATLTEAVQRGSSIFPEHPGDRGKNRYISFIAAMHERARKQVSVVMALLDFTGIKRILDVGGGSGEYAMAFVRAHPEVSADVFDLPDIIPLTETYINRENLRDRINCISGDYTQDDLVTRYDMVFLSAVIHSNSYDVNRRLIKKCADAVNSGGQVVVLDFIMDEDRINPANGAFFALNMLVGTESGDTYTESEVRQWMTDAGLKEIIRKDTGFGSALVIGRKA
jgi:SAM-dependent methyltransferase